MKSTKGKSKVTTTGEFGGPSGRHVGGGSREVNATAEMEEQGHLASGASRPMGNPHGSDQATRASKVMGFKGGEGFSGGDKGDKGGEGFVVLGITGKDNGKGQGEGNIKIGKGGGKGKGKGEGDSEGKEKREGKKRKKKKEEEEVESVWVKLRKKWDGVIQDSRFESTFERLYDQWVELERGIVVMYEEEDADVVSEMNYQFIDLSRETVNGFEELGRRVLEWEGRMREITRKSGDIVCRQKEQMDSKDRQIEELKVELERKESELERLTRESKSVEEGMTCLSTPVMVERSTSTLGDSSEGLRALVREVVREEVRNMGGNKEKGREGKGGVVRQGRDMLLGAPVVPSVVEVRDDRRSYASVMRTLRKEVVMDDFSNVDVRVMPSGVARITLRGENRDAARRVASSFREVLGEGARVSCPCPMGRIEVAGFDLSIRESELATSISRQWDVLPADLSVGKVGRTRGGAGRALVRLPLVIAKRACREGLRVGWGRARVYEVGPRRVQCFRCLGFDHTQARCVATVVASGHPVCYACAKPGHSAYQCGDTPTCAACGLRGWATSHRMGGPQCQTLAAYTSRQGPGDAGEEVPVQGAGVAEFVPPPAPRKRQRENEALSSQEGSSSETPPAKTIAKTPLPVGGPTSGLPPEGLDPGEESIRMDVAEED